jgi:hypothetical protein
MIKMSLAGIAVAALAVGHQAFHASLNGTSPTANEPGVYVVHSQAGASALGTAFAFLVSSFLGISRGTAFVQCAWMVVQKRSFTLAGLDALSSSPYTPTAFLF